MIKTATRKKTKTDFTGDALVEKRLKKLRDVFWRLNNLYYILDEQGNRVLFKLNAVQKALYMALWWLNIIPKSRQHGITTFITLFMLDACLFNSNIRAGIVAHKLADAKKIFRDKIKYAYENLPTDLKAARSLLKDDAQELIFNNNSGIYVGTSMRSGTLQYLHISEYGWMCTHAPLKAAEIKTGAMETVHADGMIFIESTAEGSTGDFPMMCKEAEQLKMASRELGPLDYKLHFFPWHEKTSNVTDPLYVEIPETLNTYFDKLEKVYDKKLSLHQRAWYTAKKKTLKHLMFKEHPSTMEEAFIASVEGAYYASEISQMRESGRICKVPFLPGYSVHTVCDLGLGGNMPWIFFQVVGLEVHIINCFSLSGKDDVRGGMVFFKSMLDKMKEGNGYLYGKHFCPFDVSKGEIGTGKAIYDTAAEHGIHFHRLEREKRVLDGIERMTNMFPQLYIDADNCRQLINAWSSYRRQWFDNLDAYGDAPVHDKASHYADAGRYLSMVIANNLCSTTQTSATMSMIKRWQAKYARN